MRPEPVRAWLPSTPAIACPTRPPQTQPQVAGYPDQDWKKFALLSARGKHAASFKHELKSCASFLFFTTLCQA